MATGTKSVTIPATEHSVPKAPRAKKPKSITGLNQGDIIAFKPKTRDEVAFKIMVSPTQCFHVLLKDLDVSNPSLKADADGLLAGHVKLGRINFKALLAMGLKHKATNDQLGIKTKKVKKQKQVWHDGY